ncbi:MAG: N-6 DNA methylase [Candidatus Aenigmatarchaeota archaeon]
MSIQYGERWAQGIILQWLNQTIKEQKLAFKRADQEVQIRTVSGFVKYPDIIIWDSSDKVACLIELKSPLVSAYDEELVGDALRKATEAGIPFFVTWNINKLVLWETFRPGTTLLERRLLHEEVVDIKDLKELTRGDVEKAVRSFLVKFLKELWAYYETKVAQPEPLKVFVLPKLPPDEILVYYLKTAVDSLFIPIFNHLIKKKEREPEFLNKLAKWFVEQGWIFEDSEDDYDRISRQSVYLLINKILFYNILRERFRLSEINIKDVISGEELKKRLQGYFNEGIRLNPRYGIIFATDFLEMLPIPDEVVNGIKRLIDELNKYDFSEIGYDIVGKIFEKLIPKTERHKLGQYFTSTDIVDLILGFTVKHPDDKVLDPACGSGTFLVRAYHRKRYLAQKLFKEGRYPKPVKSHQELIKELWGIDVAKFPAHLALINLVREEIESIENIPNIACRDFFDILPDKKSMLYELAFPLPEVKKEELQIEFHKDFKAVVTNPPYTRQEEMEDIFLGGYKDRLRELVKRFHGIEVSKRSSIYVYFFLHGSSFLAKDGRIGLITSNSWLDVDFGKHLQEFFLKNFKIIAILESKVERWFEDADINTAITILERCSNEKTRDSNLVKFVYLKKKLRELLPVTENEEERWNIIEKFVDFIENCDKDKTLVEQMKKIEFLGKTLWIYENDDFRITMISQADLWAEGWNEEEGKYDGSKWGKYIRAPEIFFKILEKGRGLFVPLKKVAEVRRGFTTGANEFFYLTEERIKELGIEREFWMHPVRYDEWLEIKDYIPKEDIWLDKDGEYFKNSQYSKDYKLDDVLIDGNVIWIPNYVIKSPRECKSIIVKPKDLKYRVLMIHKDKKELRGTNVLKYIEWGEEQGFHKRPTCASRQRWYELTPIRGDLLCMMSLNDRHVFWINKGCYFDARLYGITIKKSEISAELLGAFLNSSITPIFVELWGRVNLGQGALDVKVYEYGQIPVIEISAIPESKRSAIIKSLNLLSQREIKSVFSEINAESPIEVKLEHVKPDRKELDEHFIKDLIILSLEEQLEIYKAIIDLVKTRLERAKTVEKRKKKKEVNIESLANNIVSRLTNQVKKFPKDYLKDYRGLWSNEISIPKGKVVFGSDLSGFYVQVGGEEIYRSWNEKEVRFVYYAALTGSPAVKLPLDRRSMEKALESFEADYGNLKKEVNELLSSLIPDAKVRRVVEDKVWKLLFSQVK